MTKASNRTRPLDRDGDGRDGGSLPGNKTAPMASALGDPIRPDDGPPNAEQTPPEQPEACPICAVPFEGDDLCLTDITEGTCHAACLAGSPAVDLDTGAPIETAPTPYRYGDIQPKARAVDDLSDARTTPGDSPEKLEAIEREVDEANAASAANLTGDAALTAIAEAEPEIVGQVINDHGDGPDAGMHDTEIVEDADDDTFTPEEVAAAGQVQVVEAEGEAPAVAADPTVIPTNDPLIQIETETAPIAVRERELRLLVESRRLYKSPQGYSSNYGAPYVDEATVQAWIAADLAEDVPSAGTWGGVKPTHEARRQLSLIRHGEPA